MAAKPIIAGSINDITIKKNLWIFYGKKKPQINGIAEQGSSSVPVGCVSNDAIDTGLKQPLIQAPQKHKKTPVFDPEKNHGRYAAADYTGCLSVNIQHEYLRKGERCPDCEAAAQRGTLYAVPKSVIR